MKQRVEVSQKLLNNPAFWSKESERFYYSGHCHRGSAIETDDTCGNCNGANCQTCRKVIVESRYSFSCYTDLIFADLVEQGIEEGIASELAYSDWGCKTHYLVMSYEIPEETRKRIETPDAEVWAWCEENYDCSRWFYFEDKYREYLLTRGISWEDGLQYYLNQAEFWYNTNKRG